MNWFDRHAGEDAGAFYERLSAAVANSGLQEALASAVGPVGLRRFVVRAEVRGSSPRIVAVDGPVLPRGGGPPSPAAWVAGSPAVEAALLRLRSAFGPAAPFAEVAIGYVRHGNGESDLSLRFDEDVAGFRASTLETPTGQPAVTEDPAYVRAAAQWAARIDEMRGRFTLARGAWTLAEGRLDDGERRVTATAIATWHPMQRRFDWLLTEPAGEEAPFVEPEFTVDLAGAMELVCFAALRVGATGVFQGSLPTGMLAFIGVRGTT